MRPLIVASVGAVAVLFAAAWGLADAQPESPVAVRTTDNCGSDQQTDRLVESLRARLSERDVVHLKDDAKRVVDVEWLADDRRGCVLQVRTDDALESLDLAEDAGADAIHHAAVRAVWLLTDRSPLGGSPPTEGDATVGADTGRERPVDAGSDASPESDTEESYAIARPDFGAADRDVGAGAQTDLRADTGRADARRVERGDVASEETNPTPKETTEARKWTAVPYQLELGGVEVPDYEADRVVPNYALNIVGTQYGVDGAEVGALANVHPGFVHGVQLAGIANYTGEPSSGFQGSLLTNFSEDEFSGVSSTLAVNYAGSLSGLQAALGANLASGDSDGAQFGLALNWVGGSLDGVQAGPLNISGDLRGAQFGLLNIGRDVDGAQFGLLNIARKSTFSLGLLSINWGRPLYVGLTQDISGFVLLEVEHGSKRFHHVFAGGYHPYNPTPTSSLGAGVGFDLGERPVTFDIELLAHFVTGFADAGVATSVWSQLRATAVWSLTKRFALTGGVSGNLMAGIGELVVTAPTLPNASADGTVWLWPGLHAGVRF